LEGSGRFLEAAGLPPPVPPSSKEEKPKSGPFIKVFLSGGRTLRSSIGVLSPDAPPLDVLYYFNFELFYLTRPSASLRDFLRVSTMSLNSGSLLVST